MWRNEVIYCLSRQQARDEVRTLKDDLASGKKITLCITGSIPSMLGYGDDEATAHAPILSVVGVIDAEKWDKHDRDNFYHDSYLFCGHACRWGVSVIVDSPFDH